MCAFSCFQAQLSRRSKILISVPYDFDGQQMFIFFRSLPSMILFTLQMRRVMMRLMASQGLLGPLATVEATIGARESTITAPSNTCRSKTQKCYICYFIFIYVNNYKIDLQLQPLLCLLMLISCRSYLK